MAFKVITINSANVDSNLTDFPLVITGRDLPAAFWTDATTTNVQAKSDGGGSNLTTEVAWIDSVNEEARIHVKVPTISSSGDTIIELHWDVTQVDTGAVFTMYSVVIPLTVNAFGNVANYGSDGTAVISEGTAAPASYNFDGMQVNGSGQRLEVTMASELGMYQMVHYKRDTDIDSFAISSHASGSNFFELGTFNDGVGIEATLYTFWNDVLTSIATNPGTGTYFTLSSRLIGNSEYDLWLDGASNSSGNPGISEGSMDELYIGSSYAGNGDLVGRIKEVRWSQENNFVSPKFTNEWVKFEHYNVENVNDYTVGDPAPPTPPRPVRSIKVNYF